MTTATTTATERPFDVGETFSGVDIEAGLAAVEKIQAILPEDETLASLALRFCSSASGYVDGYPGSEDSRAGARQCQRGRAPRPQRRGPGPFARDIPDLYRPVGTQSLVTPAQPRRNLGALSGNRNADGCVLPGRSGPGKDFGEQGSRVVDDPAHRDACGPPYRCLGAEGRYDDLGR